METFFSLRGGKKKKTSKRIPGRDEARKGGESNRGGGRVRDAKCSGGGEQTLPGGENEEENMRKRGRH